MTSARLEHYSERGAGRFPAARCHDCSLLEGMKLHDVTILKSAGSAAKSLALSLVARRSQLGSSVKPLEGTLAGRPGMTTSFPAAFNDES